MTYPKVYIVLLTYTPSLDHPRARYAEWTLRSVLDRLRYPGPVSVHIADDGSPPEHRNRLVEIAGGYSHVSGVTVTNAEQKGYGASYNLATQVVHNFADVILPLEDDWTLNEPLNIAPHVETLFTSRDPEIHCIRLGYIGFTDKLRCVFSKSANQLYLVFDPDSPEHHVNAGHPRLETVGFERRVGEWREELDPGSTERDWCGRKAARVGVAWPLAGPKFSHIGTVQARSDQYAAEAI